jgi:uncharacterized membrane protein
MNAPRILKFAILSFFLLAPLTTNAAPTPEYQPDEYSRGTVVKVIRESAPDETGIISQFVEVSIKNLPEAKKIQEVVNTVDKKTSRGPVSVGDDVVVIKVPDATNGDQYYISDNYRLNGIIFFAVLFFIIVLILGRWRGLTSIVGLVGGVVVLAGFIIPLIVRGHNPLLVVTTGSVAIICVSMFFAHGLNRSTVISVISTGITLALASVLAYAAVHLTFLFGTGSEEAMFVSFGSTESLDLRGILLAGIIIGTLGVLDDITTAQTAAVRELHDTKPDMAFSEMFMRVMRIGREHIASLVNTLVLAYAGASFPLFLLFYTTNAQPLWAIINSQQIAEEIVRTLVGSTALVLAVPISSAIAAYYYTKMPHLDKK